MSTEPEPVILRITAVYEYQLEPDLAKRQDAFGTTDPAECARIDAENDPADLMLLADMKSFTVAPVTAKPEIPANDDTLTVWCPYCQAWPGQWCKDFRGGSAIKLHASRVKAAVAVKSGGSE